MKNMVSLSLAIGIPTHKEKRYVDSHSQQQQSIYFIPIFLILSLSLSLSLSSYRLNKSTYGAMPSLEGEILIKECLSTLSQDMTFIPWGSASVISSTGH
jgi:hypothetical protein